ncbi:nuclear transport factor 2 family protein [Dactylosporangium sp. NPDC000555]|uniref:YybH family protein n=1 Tax=Dactylosporangium sp. NPDC000555 TaxID=3154260 RepID=UPI00331824E3
MDDEGEIRELHARWFAAGARKDLDALMAPIAADVVSYEHVAPLEYVGIDAVREVCRQGLEASDNTVTWEVPDLRVVVDGDLAVGWGLNRIRVPRPDGSTTEYRSRGTRVFRRTGGEWKLVHQHLSFPQG